MGTGTAPVISIKGLTVSYGQIQAVSDLSLQIHERETFGLLGPNGAGKTTTLSAIEGLVAPRSGTVRVLGFDVRQNPREAKLRLGIGLQATHFFDDLRAWELVRFYAALFEVFPEKRDIMGLLARFELQDKANALAGQLSVGQQQRLALAVAMANNPQILVLDEPTAGLDPQSRRAIWDIVRGLRAEGCAVLLTTHYLDEAQELWDRVGIIDRGRLIELGTPAHLVNSLDADSLVVAAVRLPLHNVLILPGVASAQYDGDRLLVRTRVPHETLVALQMLAAAHEQQVADLQLKQPDLEDVFVAPTGRRIPSPAGSVPGLT